MTANLVLAFLVVVGYAINRLTRDELLSGQFLGYSLLGGRIAILFAALNVAAILLIFLWRRFLLMDQLPTRIACAFFGIWGLLFTAVLPALKSHAYGESMLTLDNALGWYVWSAHLLFGVVGSNEKSKVS